MLRYTDPFLRTLPLRRVLDRMLEDLSQGPGVSGGYEGAGGTQQGPQAQAIPVNIFQTPEQIVLVAPMPGVHPDDIEASVTGDTVYLRAELRGPHQEEKDYLVREWSYGPYERTVRLPVGVDAQKANASFDNGLLVLTLPRRDVTRAHRITLQSGGSDLSNRGIREVRSGQDSKQQEGETGGASGVQGTGAAPGGASSNGGASDAGGATDAKATSRTRKK